MAVPAPFADDPYPSHGLIAWHHVLDRAWQHVSIVWQTGRERWSVIKYEISTGLVFLDTLLKNSPLLPEREHRFFMLGSLGFVCRFFGVIVLGTSRRIARRMHIRHLLFSISLYG